MGDQAQLSSGGCWNLGFLPGSRPHQTHGAGVLSAPVPATTNGSQEVDISLIQELNEMTVKEREEVYDEIHGILHHEKETPEFVEECFVKLRLALSQVSRNQRKAYEKALFLRPSLEHDRAFQLMFLRGIEYDCTEAAARICAYFEKIVF